LFQFILRFPDLLLLRVGRDYGNFGRNDIKILNRNKKKIQIGEVD